MKKITVLTALLAVLAVTAGLLWPGRVLARRERRLYGQIVTGAAAVSAFERGETTLAQRIAVLGSINNTVPAMDFPQERSYMTMNTPCAAGLSGN